MICGTNVFFFVGPLTQAKLLINEQTTTLHFMLQWFDFMNLDLIMKNINDSMPRKGICGGSNGK
jgi:hypothetical protein